MKNIMTRKQDSSLQKKEPRPAMVLRLLIQAQTGKPYDTSVADALENHRQSNDLSRSEFAAILGMYPSHYSEVLHGKRQLTLDATRRAFAIGVAAEALLQSEKDE